jgi:hypothetical protein
MRELMWFLLASIPFISGLSFVVMGWRERGQGAAAQARADAGRR